MKNIIKKSKIYFLLYNNKLFVKEKDEIEIILIDKNILKKGRIEDLNYLIKTLKKSKIMINSFLKLVSDNLIFIYFGNYNKLELNNIKMIFNEFGFFHVNFIDIIMFLDNSYNYILDNNDKFYLIIDSKKSIVSKLDYIDNKVFTNSKTICDSSSYDIMKRRLDKTSIYAVDDICQYILNQVS